MRRNQVTALQFSNGGVDCASPTVDELISYANVLRGAHQSGVESMPASLSNQMGINRAGWKRNTPLLIERNAENCQQLAQINNQSANLMGSNDVLR
jgi:hypothetical protein